jgi:hypothetical protein
MSISDIKDPSSVTKAAEEFVSLGREAFSTKYGLGKATSASAAKVGQQSICQTDHLFIASGGQSSYP